MLINFLGSPQSGKTTTAAMLFAKLKENHMVAEFVLEQARMKIAKNRVYKGFNSLTSEDQNEIFMEQIESESVMSRGNSAIVVSDSSPINNLLYCPDWKKDHWRQTMVSDFLSKNNPLVFLCLPIDSSKRLTDMNRIHSLEESIALHNKFDEILEYFQVKPVMVYGSPEERLEVCLKTVYDKVVSQ